MRTPCIPGAITDQTKMAKQNFTEMPTPMVTPNYISLGLHHILLCTSYKCVFFFAHGHFFLFRPGSFSCSRLRGEQGARPNTTAQVRALAEVRGTCSGGSKSRKLASNHGEAFRARRAIQADANPRTGFKKNRTGCACRSEFC